MSGDETTAPDVESDLSRYPLPRLIFYLYKRQFTGSLEVRRPEGDVARALFREGLPCHVEMRAMEDVLGRVLLEQGWITQAQYDDSLAELAKGGSLHGQILLGMSAIDVRQLIGGLQLQLRRKLNRLFQLREAPFALYSCEHGHGLEGEEQTVRADPLWVIHQGVRNAFDEARLAPELAKLRGNDLQLTPGFAGLLDRFGLNPEEKHFAQVLAHGALRFERALTISNLSSRVQTQMLLYALWVCEGLIVSAPTAAVASTLPTASPPPRMQGGGSGPGTAPSLAALASDFAAAPRGAEPPGPSPPGVPAAPPLRPAGSEGVGRYRSAVRAAEPAVPAPRQRKDSNADALIARIEARLEGIDQRTHFEVLEIDREASAAATRDAYFKLAKEFHPDRVAGLGCGEEVRLRAEELFRRIGEAHSTLSDANRRAEYVASLDEPDVADEARTLLEAELAFQKGTVFFKKRDFPRALELFEQAWRLNDQEGEHLAWLAWSRYCNLKGDKKALLQGVVDDLRHAAKISPKRAQTHYFLGEALLAKGEERRAIAAFEQTVEINGQHVDALRQLRLVRMRQQRGGQDAGGGRLRSISKLFKNKK